jgi:hypothetical protein
MTQTELPSLKGCPHGRNREREWCEPCFRKEQRQRWGYSSYDYCDLFGRGHG